MLTYEEQKANIARLNLMDNGFFQKVMQDIEICEEMLRILLQMPDLKVKSNQVERNIPNLANKAVTLDLYCEDRHGNMFNVEVQKSNDTNHQKRVRYNMACMDTLSIDKGTAYHQLPDLYVIFISAFDLFKENKTVYHAQRILRETGTFIENGTHEIYVNTKIDDGSDIAQLMQYFKNSTGIHPLFPKLSKQIHYYKETSEGVNTMVDVWEEYAEKRANELANKIANELANERANEIANEIVTDELKKSALFLLKEGIAPEIVAQANKLPLETVLQLQKEIELQNA